ncbi:MAG: YjjG family noncanonical pyrimidine nucleotidase [Oscillospiraceae bacterium]|nr:YjjG family noncanonical pyrimidine nucleotidase [Oscillospiraceae bacterium]
MRYDVVLWDVDGTLLNFDAAEEKSLRDCLRAYGVELTDAQVCAYQAINRRAWERLERGEIDRQTVFDGRFTDFFALIGAPAIDVRAFNEAYQKALGENYVWERDARAVCAALLGRVRMYAVTNGSASVQHSKLAGSGLRKYLDGVFISEELGVEKPDARFFALCAARISGYDPKKAIIVGDSLTSDIRGGNNAGIDTCWYNPKRLANSAGVRVTCEIDGLLKLLPLLEE